MKNLKLYFLIVVILSISSIQATMANKASSTHPSQETVDFFDYLREEKAKKNESDTHQNKTKKNVLTSEEKIKNKIKQKARLFKFLKDKKLNHTARP